MATLCPVYLGGVRKPSWMMWSRKWTPRSSRSEIRCVCPIWSAQTMELLTPARRLIPTWRTRWRPRSKSIWFVSDDSLNSYVFFILHQNMWEENVLCIYNVLVVLTVRCTCVCVCVSARASALRNSVKKSWDGRFTLIRTDVMDGGGWKSEIPLLVPSEQLPKSLANFMEVSSCGFSSFSRVADGGCLSRLRCEVWESPPQGSINVQLWPSITIYDSYQTSVPE